jgi:hypothetical protein
MTGRVDARLRRRMLFKAAECEGLVAYPLALCAHARGQAVVDLCELLGCDEYGLFRLALCRRPREGEDPFRSDVELIASFARVDSHALANLLREASFLEALPGGADAGRILWAAREQDDQLGTPSQHPERSAPYGRRDDGDKRSDDA